MQKASIKELAESLFPLVDMRINETLPMSEAYRSVLAVAVITMAVYRTTASNPALRMFSIGAVTSPPWS